MLLDNIFAIEPDAPAKNGMALSLGIPRNAQLSSKTQLVFHIEKEPVRRAL
jgi:hypothetical protein